MKILKERFKLGFNLFIYLSLLFLAYFLYKQNYLAVPKEFNPLWMSFSLAALFIGFVINSIQWVPLLKSQGLAITYKDSIRTFGMAVFGKYIPGKVWVHIGKSAQIANAYNYSIAKVSEISFFSQILSLWVGAIAGLIVLGYLGQYDMIFWAFLGFVVVSSLAISTKSMQNLASAIIHRVFKKKFTFSSLGLTDFHKVLPLYFISIFAYSVGFLFLAKSIGAVDMVSVGMFIFPLAMSIGVVAIIVPGGLGVREVVISSIMGSMMVSVDLSNTIALASRLWFLMGEVFIFLMGLYLQSRLRSRDGVSS